MSPAIPRSYFPDVIPAYRKPGGYLAVRKDALGVKSPDFNNIVVFKFGPSAVLSFVSPLLGHIPHVVSVCPQSNVRRIAAQLVPNAGMQDELPGWNSFSIGQNPSYAMRGSVVTMPRNPADVDNSVAAPVKAALPVPALAWRTNFNVGPKQGFEVSRKYSRDESLRDSLCSHNSVRLICATLSGEPTPRGHFYFTSCA